MEKSFVVNNRKITTNWSDCRACMMSISKIPDRKADSQQLKVKAAYIEWCLALKARDEKEVVRRQQRLFDLWCNRLEYEYNQELLNKG